MSDKEEDVISGIAFVIIMLIVVGILVGTMAFLASRMTDEHDFWLVDPTKDELLAVESLGESKFIREAYFSVGLPVQIISVNDERYCLVKFLTNTRSFDGPKARDVMDEAGIPYFRTEEEALQSIGYTDIEGILKRCEVK